MKNKIVGFSLLGLLAVGSLFYAKATDVTRYLVVKGLDYWQTNATTVNVISNQAPFSFVSSVDGAASNSVLAASLKLPNLQTRTLTNNDGNFDFETGFSNKLQLDAAYGVGNYSYTITGTNDGTYHPVLALPADNYPSVPNIANWTDLQAVEASQPLNISWGAFTNGTTNDFIIVDVSSADGSTTLASTPALLDPSALNGTNITAQLPAGVLADGSNYQGRVLFVKRASINTTGYPGSKGVSGYFRQTMFPVVTLPTPPASGRIQFSAQNYSAAENGGTTPILVTRSGSTGAVSVNFATQDGTGHDGTDYTGVATTLNFADGQTNLVVPITVIDNFVLDGNRTVSLWLTNPQGGAVLGGRTNSVLTIVDNEVATAGKLQFATRSNSVAEAGKVVTLTINRVGGSVGTVTANYATTNGTAIAGLNYVATNGSVVFAPGILSKTITVPILNDSLYESNEVFSVTLTGTSGGAALGTNSTTQVGIVNDDFGGTFAFKQSSYVTNENSTNFVVTVVRTGGTASGVTVDYYTQDGSAVSGVRYYGTNGTLSFGSNELSKTFVIGITNDLIPDGNVSFTAVLTNATGGAKVSTNAALNTATFTILDDESSVSFSNATYSLSEAGGKLTVIAVRSGALITPVSVDFNTADITATSSANYGATNGTLTFPAHVSAKSFTVNITNNTVVDGNHTFLVQLANPQGGTQLGTVSNAVVTIVDDDRGGAISFGATNFVVSAAGTNAVVSIVRSNGIASGVAVGLVLTDGTATAGVNYSNVSQTLTFNAGETNKKVLLPIINDGLAHASQNFFLMLTNPAGGASLGVRPNATVTITNNEAGGVISFTRTNFSALENTTNFLINVRRSGGKAGGVTVDFYTQNGTATDGVRYIGTNGSLTFGPGETNKTIAVGIINDFIVNGNQSFNLVLANAGGGATLAPTNIATLTVIDDESSIGFSSPTYTVNETAGTLTVTVVRNGALLTPVTVGYSETDASAQNEVNFIATTNTLFFPTNVSSKTFTVPIIHDTRDQGDLSFNLWLFNPTGGTQINDNNHATATIIEADSDGVVGFSTNSYSVSDSGTNAIITIVRTNGLSSGSQVDFVTTDGSALAGIDYTNATQTLTFNAGVTSLKVQVPITKQTTVQPNKTLTLALVNPTGHLAINSSLGTASLNILENKNNVSIQTATYNVNKTDSNAVITLVRNGLLTSQATVSYSTANGTALTPADYHATSGTATFGPGVSSKTILVPIVNNLSRSGDTTFSFRIASPVGTTLGAVTNSTVNILDGGTTSSFISLSTDFYTVNKTNPYAIVTLNRTGGLSTSTAVDITTADGTASSLTSGYGRDYISIFNTVTFAPGASSTNVSIPLVNNPYGGTIPIGAGSNRWFSVTLQNPSGSQLGTITTAQVSIADTLNHGSVQFSSATYTGSASGAGGTGTNVTITLTRTGGADGTVYVFYSMTDGTAVSSQVSGNNDYQNVSGYQAFTQGVTSKTISVPLIVNNNSSASYPRTVALNLNTFFFGVSPGTTTNAVLNINQ